MVPNPLKPTFSNSACPIGPDDVTDALEAVGPVVGTADVAGAASGCGAAPWRLRRGARASKAKAKRDGKVARMATTKPGEVYTCVKFFQNTWSWGELWGFWV